MEVPPSQNTNTYWIEALAPTTGIPINHPPENGKWLVFRSLNDLDNSWDTIRQGTESGLLGYYSSVSTLKNDTEPIDGHVHENKVICVFTYSENDEQDIFRVREELRRMGFGEKLYYKTRQATQDGEFSHLGYENISKYES